ncbi:MAG: glycosyltransferase family 39 protein [Phycisphaerae bacterium]
MSGARQFHSEARRAARVPFLIALILIVAGAVLHLWYLLANCPLDLSGDEAHYWEWSRHLDLSYYSKGPLVAYIIAAGRVALADASMRLMGNETLAVRVPAILLSVVTSLGIYTLTARAARDWHPHVDRAGSASNSRYLALGAVALTFSMPILVVGSMLMTIDAPLSACWVWGIIAAYRALRHDRIADWIGLGLLVAIGILAKYTMLLLVPAVGLFILLDAAARRLLTRPGPYLAAVIGACGMLPILIWNAQHDWVSFRHVAGQAGLGGAQRHFDLGGIVEYVGGQLAVVGPAWIPLMLIATLAAWREARKPRVDRKSDLRGFIAWAVLVPWTVFLLFSPVTKIQPNWPVISVFPGTVLLVGWIAERWTRSRPLRTAVAIASVFGLAAGIVLHRTDWLYPAFARLAANAPPWDLTPIAKYDPASRLRGWRQLGAAVGNVLAREREAGREPFVVADDYQVASQIAFYCPSSPPVYCIQVALGERLSQYDVWENPIRDRAHFVGRPCIYVGSRRAEIVGGDGHAAAMPALSEPISVEHRVGGHLLAMWTIYVCQSFAGFEASGVGSLKY